MRIHDSIGNLRWPRSRAALAWIALAALIALRCHQAWHNFDEEKRPERNIGHTQIDFAGQYMFGRLVREGHVRELYSRDRHLEVARQRFAAVSSREPARDEDGEEHVSPEQDAIHLIEWYPVSEDQTLAGPLYPPIHAFVMAPIAGIDNPQHAYRIWQLTMIGCLIVAGWGVRVISDGHWWWPVATMLLLAFSGARAGIDLGQNAALTVMLIILGWALRVRQRPILAGIVWGLLAFKPVWAMSFFGALVFLRQWRMLMAMGATGIALIIATLPVVGIDTWKNWLEVGKIAAETYNTDRNWIFLSRDLFGIPRRLMTEFDEYGTAINNRPLIAKVGWLVWSLVFLVTAFVARRRRLNDSLIGPGPALAFFAGWMLTYRFMYYDCQIACFAVLVLLAVPAKWIRFSSWPLISWGVIWALIPVVYENFINPQDFQFTIFWHRVNRQITFHFNDHYPIETFIMFTAWLWCIRTVWFGWDKAFR